MFGVLAFPSLLAPEHTQGSLCITVRKDVARGSLIIVNYLSPPPVICLLFVPVTAEPVAQLVGGSAAGHQPPLGFSMGSTQGSALAASQAPQVAAWWCERGQTMADEAVV